MKKTGLWIGILMAFVLGMLSVSAASTDTAVPAGKQTAVILGDVSVESGTTTASVPVYLKQADDFSDGILATEWKITYSADKLEYKQINWNTELYMSNADSFYCFESSAKDSVSMTLTWITRGKLTGKSTYIGDLVFTLKDNTTPGLIPLTIADDDTINLAISDSPKLGATYALFDGGITVQAPAVEHTITFADGGHGTLTTASQTVEENVASALPTLAKSGVYNFAGWTDGTNLYPAGATITTASDVTLTAIWFADITTDSGYIATSSDAAEKTYAIGIQAELNASIFDSVSEFGFYYYIPEKGEAAALTVSSDELAELKTKNGKFYTYIIDIPAATTEIVVKSYLKVGDSYVYGTYQTYTPANAASDAAPKYLGKNY